MFKHVSAIAIIAGLLGFTASTDAFAEDKSALLKGVGKVQIGSVGLDEDDESCGITDENRFKFTSRDKLEEAGLGSDMDSEILFWITFTTLRLEEEERCITNLGVEVSEYQEVTFENRDLTSEAEIMLWREEMLVSTDPFNHRDNMDKMLEKLLGSFLEDWKQVN